MKGTALLYSVTLPAPNRSCLGPLYLILCALVSSLSTFLHLSLSLSLSLSHTHTHTHTHTCMRARTNIFELRDQETIVELQWALDIWSQLQTSKATREEKVKRKAHCGRLHWCPRFFPSLWACTSETWFCSSSHQGEVYISRLWI